MSVLNIIELQNVVTSSSGLNPTTYLSNQIINMQQMVNYDEKRLNVNVISNFNTTPIQVVSPINFSNTVTFTASNTSTTTTNISTIGTGSLGLLTIGGPNSLELIQNTSTSFYINNGNATFSGTVSAESFITLSDGSKKHGISPITNYVTILSTIQGVKFKWNDTKREDVGIIAQDLQNVLPEAVYETPYGLQVAYMKIIPVLVEAVKNLQERVKVLEAGTS